MWCTWGFDCLIFNFLLHSAFPLSPGPEVHLGQDASLPTTAGHLTPSQESDIALEKTPGIWPGWAQMSQMEGDLLPCSDWKRYCLNIGVLPLLSNGKWDSTNPLLFPVSWFATTCPRSLLCSMCLAIRLSSRTVRSSLKPWKEHPTLAAELRGPR